MGEQPIRPRSSADIDFDFGTWMILVGLLVLGVAVSVGGLAITSINQQGQTATGAQTVPTPR